MDCSGPVPSGTQHYGDVSVHIDRCECLFIAVYMSYGERKLEKNIRYINEWMEKRNRIREKKEREKNSLLNRNPHHRSIAVVHHPAPWCTNPKISFYLLLFTTIGKQKVYRKQKMAVHALRGDVRLFFLPRKKCDFFMLLVTGSSLANPTQSTIIIRKTNDSRLIRSNRVWASPSGAKLSVVHSRHALLFIRYSVPSIMMKTFRTRNEKKKSKIISMSNGRSAANRKSK